MKSLILAPVVIFALVWVGIAQAPSPTPTPDLTPREVTQDFIDAAVKAFKLVKDQREALDKFITERKLVGAETKAAALLTGAIDELVKIHESTLKQAEKIQKMYETFIDVQQKFIEKLIGFAREKQKDGFWSKVWKGFKQIATAVLFFYAGRGVSVNQSLIESTDYNSLVIEMKTDKTWFEKLRRSLHAMVGYALLASTE